jgi:hypothetical protein
MAYSPTYTSDDIPSIVIDFIGKYAIQIVAFAGLIALVGLYVWFKRNAK